MNNEIANGHSYLDLATSHVTQLTNGSEKSDWSIELNETNEKVFTLPKLLNEQQVFGIMDFMKEYELKAFNTGIRFQKDKNNMVLKETIDRQNTVIKALEEENIRLSNILESIIGEDEAN